MRQFLTLPILVPIVLGIALLILQPEEPEGAEHLYHGGIPGDDSTVLWPVSC